MTLVGADQERNIKNAIIQIKDLMRGFFFLKLLSILNM
jgi:hypothetical protein